VVGKRTPIRSSVGQIAQESTAEKSLVPPLEFRYENQAARCQSPSSPVGLCDPGNCQFLSGPERIAKGYLFVLGDNRDNSADSRYRGYVPLEMVRGKRRFIYWSSDESGIRWNRINQVIE
jgi:signal peptidase I